MFFLLNGLHLAWPLTVLLMIAMVGLRLFIRRGRGGRGPGSFQGRGRGGRDRW
jgi:hypothetical protein